MSKRRATDELYTADDRKRQDAPADRAAEFTAHLRALNGQFAEWVHQQAASSSDQLWLAGVSDYVRFADNLLDDFQDVLKNGRKQSPPAANDLFGTPAAAPAATRTSDAHTSRSTGATAGGRKSVSFAATPSLGAAADTEALTPGASNVNNVTANAGHTPAPASGLGFNFGANSKPAAAAVDVVQALPVYGASAWGSSTPAAAGVSAIDGTAPTTRFTSTAGTSGKPEEHGGKSAGATPTKAFTFGTSTSSTPAAAGGSDIAAASAPSASPYPSSAGGFSFGASFPGSTSSSPGGAASSTTPVSTFSFGVLPPSSAVAATSNSPIFSFAGNSAAVASTSGNSMFKFPAPAAAGDGVGGDHGSGGGASGDDGAEEEASAKYKPEITVDENTWNVFFNGKARLHVRRVKDGKSEWASKGLGVLTVRQRKDGGDSSTYVTFTNDGGKQLVSSRLQKTTQVHIVPEQPKKCRISLTVIHYDLPPAGTPGADAAAAATSRYSVEVCMVSLSSPEKMLELQQAVNQHKPK